MHVVARVPLLLLLLAVGRHVAADAEVAVEVVAGVAHVAARVRAAGEGDHGTVAGDGRLRAGAVAPAAGVGHPRQAAVVAVAEPPAAVGGHGGRSGHGAGSSYGSVNGGG